jgi:hypothetical protein
MGPFSGMHKEQALENEIIRGTLAQGLAMRIKSILVYRTKIKYET